MTPEDFLKRTDEERDLQEEIQSNADSSPPPISVEKNGDTPNDPHSGENTPFDRGNSSALQRTNAQFFFTHKNSAKVPPRKDEKRSLGKRINTAADDAAELAKSEKMRMQIRGLDAAGKEQDSHLPGED